MSLTKEDVEAFLLQLSSTFKYQENPVLWMNSVMKVGRRNVLQPRTLVITPSAIVLLRVRSFPRSTKLVRAISIFDLSNIQVSGETVSFSGSIDQIRVKHENASYTAFLTFFIRQAQFPISQLPCGFSKGSDAHYNYSPDLYSYRPRHIFVDRFLSCCFSLGISIPPHVKSFQFDTAALKITKEEVDSGYLQALLLALAFESSSHVLKLSGVKLSDVFIHAQPLFVLNKGLVSLEFEGCDFAGSSDAIEKCFKNNSGHRPQSITFIGCDLSTSGFITFFDTFSSLKTTILSLRFRFCAFSKQSLSSVFQAILFNTCYHSLQSIVFEANPESFDLEAHICGLSCVSWAITSKCIRQICVDDCDANASVLMKSLLEGDIGVDELSMTGQNFQEPLILHGDFKLSRLNLRRCKFNLSSILSIFECIKNRSLQVESIDLSDISLLDCSLKDVLSRLDSLELDSSSLHSILFDNMVMDSELTLIFSRIVTRLPMLDGLSLDMSLNVRSSPSGLNELLKAISQKKMQYLSLSSDGSLDFSFGELIINYLPEIISKKTLRSLSLTGQKIGTNGMNEILHLFEIHTPEEFYFDGFSPSTFEELSDFCLKIIGSGVKRSTWPTSDFKRFLALLPADADINSLENSIREIQLTFHDKFGSDSSKPHKASLVRPTVVQGKPINVSRVSISTPSTPKKRSGSIRSTLRVENTGLARDYPDLKVSNYLDPVTSYFDNLYEKLSPDTILSSFISNP